MVISNADRKRGKMKRAFILFLLFLFIASSAHASQSSIIEADGMACMGYDKSRKQTEDEALSNAKKRAVDHTATYIKSESRLKDFELEKDLMEAYSRATVKIIEEKRFWTKDPSLGDCCQVKIKAEVIPDVEAMDRISKEKGRMEDPSAPLNVELWGDKKTYKESEHVNIYMKGNKPFYARVVCKMSDGQVLQLLPNPYRQNNYFNGGVVYEFPSAEDQFVMEVTPPFGQESIIVYASTAPLGEIHVEAAGGVYKINTESEKIGIRTRGVALKEKNPEQKAKTAEFSEGQFIFITGQ
jgi:hypothetical protein